MRYHYMKPIDRRGAEPVVFGADHPAGGRLRLVSWRGSRDDSLTDPFPTLFGS
ncbi:hypothetical protein Htur_2263 [Haloterrigena turkmenica DSM 5511]|uniref:Uncharacterized protein n=1 Tax=Haloterrigena turkmenica (strain ATCC 51198 / DSM 5511 / JCM 9101 / NCIMB 13204 / VKM B-1734 / 4k) TaxID=543526 RepID=D2RUH1_HALTV|nr:hypothetical protein Htur_2263 [Haloterrigena turkmenica DSM 5511]